MKFDRNTIIGFVLLAALFIGYFTIINKDQSAYKKTQQAKQDSINRRNDSLAKISKPKDDSLKKVVDSVTAIANAGAFVAASDTNEKIVTVENNLIKVSFSTKGGQVKRVELKKYKGQDSNLVKMAGTDFDKLSYRINTGKTSEETANLNFAEIDSASNGGNKTVSFTLAPQDSSGQYIVHEYTIKPDDYMIDFNVKMNGVDHLLQQGAMVINWQYAAPQQESDISYEKQNTQVGYVKDGEFDYHTIGRKKSKSFEESVDWVGVRQRFFFGSLTAKDKFTSGDMNWEIPADSAKMVVKATANMKLTVKPGAPSVIPFSLYYGPSEYHILKKYDMKYEKLINLGQGIYSFVRPINKYLIMPIFDFFKGFAGSMGLAIALLTIFIRLLTSPLLYKSYLSGAKMRVLRPELAQLKEKLGADQQAYSMEQMKLFREAGVNPLGGCLPALLQIPIFFALFSLFSSDIALRGAEFLWSNDLAAYDAPIKFGFSIPLLGNHISLFNVTATLTSFLISVYSMSMTPDQSNPMLKYMPYIFPIFLLFFFNSLPSALTWYYTVSNLITLALQFVIQTYIIDHDKIMVKIEETRKKPKTKSKWQERMEQMQEQQKKLKDMQQKGKR